MFPPAMGWYEQKQKRPDPGGLRPVAGAAIVGRFPNVGSGCRLTNKKDQFWGDLPTQELTFSE
jgi:hypothetical protein